VRDFRNQTDRRLLAGFILILVVVGGGLIAWLYGFPAAGLGVMCILVGVSPVVLLWLILRGLEWWGKRTGQW
jgi:hypothetical protein